VHKKEREDIKMAAYTEVAKEAGISTLGKQ